MYEVMIRLKVQEARVAEFEALVSTLVADIHANEPEPKTYEVRRGAEPFSYVYFMSFADKGAYLRYADAPYHRKASPLIVACLDGDPVFEKLEMFY